MSFRRTLFLGITLAIVAMAALEVLTDVTAERWVERREAALVARVARASAEVTGQLDTFVRARNGEMPPLQSEPAARVTVRREPEATADGVDARIELDAASGWIRRYSVPEDGVTLRVAVPIGPMDRLAAQPLVVDLLDVPLYVVVALFTAWLLTRVLLRPLRRLTAAAEAVSQRNFPGRMRVPPGDDELAQLARRFNRMTEAIRAQLERERAFTRYASHELRTPLSAFRVQVERAQLGLTEPEAVLAALERNVRRMEAVLDGLLALARSGERDDEPRALRRVVQDVLATQPPEVASRVRVNDEGCERVHVRDGALLERALHNLVDNGLRYGTGPVTVRLRTDARTLVLQVIDLGSGVPESELVHLTEPFYRGRAAQEGVGLGLALVKMIAEGLDGHFDLANHGRGLVATLRLPIVAYA